MSWTRKPKVLVMGDSSAIHTGFATVIRNICNHLYSLDAYELKTIGWFHRDTNSDIIVPYDIIPTSRIAEQQQQDTYAALTYPAVIKQFKPDIVIAVGDPWMIEHVALPPEKRDHKLLLYVPVDGVPMMQKRVATLKNADTVVAYGPFGKMVMHERDKSINVVEINHGVDIDLYRPMEYDEYKEVRESLGSDDLLSIGTICRNQPRKNLPRLIKAARIFISEYSSCQDCGELHFRHVDECISCKGGNLSKYEKKQDTRFYFHMALDDCGWDIEELAGRFGLHGYIAYPKGMQVGCGYPEETLVKIYNSLDVFTLPTGGEGWGLPIIEAMACGVPSVVTNYSAHVDFCDGAAELIEVSEFVTEAMTNVERALVDIYDYAMRLDKLYMEDKGLFIEKWGKYLKDNFGDFSEEHLATGQDARDFLSRAGRKRAEEYSWTRVNGEWVDLINTTLDYSPETADIKEEERDVAVQLV